MRIYKLILALPLMENILFREIKRTSKFKVQQETGQVANVKINYDAMIYEK